MSLGSFKFQLAGYVPAFRDAEVELVHETSGASRKVRPYLDGSVDVRNLEPGAWQVKVLHPNIVGQVIDARRIHLYPGSPTRVKLPIPASLFKDTPVRDVPDADLTPVQQAADQARAAAEPLSGKQAGDPIRAEDWNTLAQAVADLAQAVTQLTRLVSPTGHDHPELVDKIDEVNGNVRTFVDLFGRQLNELQRSLQTATIEREVEALDLPPAVKAEVGKATDKLRLYAEADTRTFGRIRKEAYRSIAETLSRAQQDPAVPEAVKEAEGFRFVAKVAGTEAEAPAAEGAAGEARGYGILNRQVGLYNKAFRGKV